MKYVIIENNQPKVVSQGIYESWLENNSDQFVLPVFSMQKGNKKYTIDTDFVGIIEKNEEPLPFVLFHFEDEISPKGKTKLIADELEHFETFEELQKRRDELIKRISKN